MKCTFASCGKPAVFHIVAKGTGHTTGIARCAWHHDRPVMGKEWEDSSVGVHFEPRRIEEVLEDA